MLFEDEPDEIKKEDRPESKSRMPKVPDLSGKLISPTTESPFLLDSFSTSSAENTTKP